MKTYRLMPRSVLVVLMLQIGLSWAQSPKYGGTLRIALSGEPAFFNANQGPAPGHPHEAKTGSASMGKQDSSLLPVLRWVA